MTRLDVIAARCVGALFLMASVTGTSGRAGGATFSVDFQGPTAAAPGPGLGLADGFGTLLGIDEGQILTVAPPGPVGPNIPLPGPLPPPGVMVDSVPASPLGSVPGGLGIVPGALGAVELDALSYGRDLGRVLQFSVDEFAVGDQTLAPLPGPVPPNVFTEGGFGAGEASADVFTYLGPVAPTPLPAVLPGLGNTAVIDGDGLAPFGGPGLGLIEPNPFTLAAVPDPGDNLDAWDFNTTLGDVLGPIFFSMDSGFIDPLEAALAPPPNTGTAPGNADAVTAAAFSGGDVAVTVAGGLPVLYAGAPLLGLDLGGFDTDDLDALALLDDGALAPATGLPFFAPGADFILFSVRRGSAVIGVADSLLGVPIEEGDVLTIPVAAGAPPAMFLPAEALGLATLRSGTTGGMAFGDDLDALDVVPEPGSGILILVALVGSALAWRRGRNARVI